MSVPKVFSSADSGAPVLTGVAGSLVALLDAVLVDGYGSGLAAKEPLGWTREYTTTNKRVFRNNPVEGTGYHLRVLDSNAQFGAMTAYAAMSDVDTGTDVFPTSAQLSAGAIWPKSGTADSTARPWWAIGTETAFYLFIQNLSAGASGWVPHFAGDIISFKAGMDPYAFALSASIDTTYSGNYVAERLFYSIVAWSGFLSSATPGLFIARDRSGVSVSAAAGAGASIFNIGQWGSGGAPYPDPLNGGLQVQDGLIMGESYLARGRYPGLIIPLHALPLTDGAIETLSDGRTVFARSWRYDNNATYGQVLFDLGDWEA